MVSGKGEKHLLFHGATGTYQIAIKQAHISNLENINDFIHICTDHRIKPETYLQEQNVPIFSLRSIFVDQNSFIQDFARAEYHKIILHKGQHVTFRLVNSKGWCMNNTFDIELSLIQEQSHE